MANGDDVQETAPAPAPKGNKGRTMAVIAIVAVLVLGGSGFFFYRQSHSAKSGADAALSTAPELYLPMDPVFVVNFQDQDSTRYLQVGVTAMTHDPAAVQAMKDNDPVIRNALVMLFSSQTYAGLSTTAGKVKLQAQALAAVRKIVADKTGKPDVDALYFTSFVMQ